MANLLIGSLDACGLRSLPIGATFISDHRQADGSIAESWLDHVYHSPDLETQITTKIINFGSSDHLPVKTSLDALVNRKSYKNKMVRRKMKNFTNEAWKESLAKQNWIAINNEPDLDKKVDIFTKLITNSLDEVAPFGVITIRSNFKFGLTDETKDLMKQREAARIKIKSSVGNEKQVWNMKYKKLRNTVTSRIRKETIDHNNNRIDNANDENEVWKVAKEIINPMKENLMTMKVNDKLTEDPLLIANTFNSFFVKKIEDLKANIDPKLVLDPLKNLKDKMSLNSSKFELKTVSIKSLKQSIKQLKAKKVQEMMV